MEASEPKRVNSNYILYGVNSHRLGDLNIKIMFHLLEAKTLFEKLSENNEKILEIRIYYF